MRAFCCVGSSKRCQNTLEKRFESSCWRLYEHVELKRMKSLPVYSASGTASVAAFFRATRKKRLNGNTVVPEGSGG